MWDGKSQSRRRQTFELPNGQLLPRKWWQWARSKDYWCGWCHSCFFDPAIAEQWGHWHQHSLDSGYERCSLVWSEARLWSWRANRWGARRCCQRRSSTLARRHSSHVLKYIACERWTHASNASVFFHKSFESAILRSEPFSDVWPSESLESDKEQCFPRQ